MLTSCLPAPFSHLLPVVYLWPSAKHVIVSIHWFSHPLHLALDVPAVNSSKSESPAIADFSSSFQLESEFSVGEWCAQESIAKGELLEITWSILFFSAAGNIDQMSRWFTYTEKNVTGESYLKAIIGCVVATSLSVECFTYTWLTSVRFKDTDGEGSEWDGPGFRFKALLLIMKTGVFEDGVSGPTVK